MNGLYYLIRAVFLIVFVCFSQSETRNIFFRFRWIINRLDFIQAFLFRIEERYDNSIYMITVLFENVFFFFLSSFVKRLMI